MTIVLIAGFAIVLLPLIDRYGNNPIIRIACVGDSLTKGSNYPEYLWMLAGSNYKVGNFGVGASTVSIQSNKPYINQSEFVEAKNFVPNIIVIMLGTNDANPSNQQPRTRFEEDYITLVREFQKLDSTPKIVLVEPPPVLRNGTGISTQFYTTSILPAIKEVASKLDLQVIDLYTPLSDFPQYFSYDGVHPNERGSQAIAEIIHNAIIPVEKQAPVGP